MSVFAAQPVTEAIVAPPTPAANGGEALVHAQLTAANSEEDRQAKGQEKDSTFAKTDQNYVQLQEEEEEEEE